MGGITYEADDPDTPAFSGLSGIRITVLFVDECPHGLDPQTCSLCKQGHQRRQRITRSTSMITKHRRFTCIVCGVEKDEDQFPTKNPPKPAPAYRDGDEPCRECRVVVRAERTANGGTVKEAIIRVQKMRKGAAQ
jgi:hypothetical protein